MAVATYVPAGVLAIGWVLLETIDGLFDVAAVLTVLGARAHTLHDRHDLRLAAHHPAVAPAAHRADLHRAGACERRRAAQPAAARARRCRRRGPAGWPSSCLAIAAGLKWAYWLRIDGEPREYTAEAATGLGHLGKVRPLEPPHTQPNFVMREMGYRVARKHALKLRNLVLLLGFGAAYCSACC